MEVKYEELVQIKSNKSVYMAGNRDAVTLDLRKEDTNIVIPMRVVHQVKRGLESYTQKFYRRKK